MNKVLHSHKSDNWASPKNYYQVFMNNGYFDPCPLNPTFDGLKIEWGKKNYVNPPYSQIKKWVYKALNEHGKDKRVVMLLPARTDTKWFRNLWVYGCHIRLITGRLHFNESKGPAPFGSMEVHITGNGITTVSLYDQEDIIP